MINGLSNKTIGSRKMLDSFDIDKELERLSALVAECRDFPYNTSPSSRHVEMHAEALKYCENETETCLEQKHMALSIYKLLVDYYSLGSLKKYMKDL